ncbi:MAG: phytanoyl-CoA dioxygenase family protein [Planctomycetota bacterium]
MRDMFYRHPVAATCLTLVEAAVHAKRYRSSGFSPADDASRAVVEALERDGVAVIPNFLNSETCATLRDAIDTRLEEAPEHAWVDPEGADHRLFGFERCSEEARSFYANPWLHRIGCSVAGCNMVNFFTLAGRISAVEGNRGSGGGWHRDSFARQFKAILYLSDVDEQSGPFEFLAGTTGLVPMLRDVWRGGLGFRQTRIEERTVERLLEADPEQLRTLVGTAGTLVLADTLGIHRGMPIEAGTRHALTNYYFARPDATAERVAHFGAKVPFADGGTLTREQVLAFEPDATSSTTPAESELTPA